MKYLKPIFESKQLNGITQKALIDAGLTKDQYMEMIDFVGKFGYSEVKEALPFLLKMIENDDYNITPVNLSKLIIFYNLKRRKSDEVESVEDYFLDLIEANQGIKVITSEQNNTVLFVIEFSDLSDLSTKLGDIDRRFKRGGHQYHIMKMENSTYVNTDQKVIYLRVEI